MVYGLNRAGFRVVELETGTSENLRRTRSIPTSSQAQLPRIKLLLTKLVSRPCKRCIQMGRSSTCTDVPHKRRGRPRLRDTPQALPAIASVSQITLPRGETSPRQTHNTSSPLAMRRPPLHSRTGSVNSPYMDFMPPALAPAWSPRQQPRRQNQSFGLLQHARNPSMIPGSPNPVLSPRSSPWSASPPEVFRPMSATLFVGIDLRIIRALSDVRNFFHAMPSVIEGRNLIELVMAEDRERLPQLIRALQEDVFTHKLLLFQSPEARQNLETDLLPYTDTDLAHSFPGAHEHLLSLTFIDALNRPVVSRMAAVLGSRSNDRFAYAIISIQRQEHPSAPATPRGGYSSVFSTSPRHFDPIMQSRRSPEFALRHPSVAGSVQISPTFSHRTIATSSPNMGALPRSVPEGYIPDYSYTNPTRSGISGLGLNVLPPLQNIAASEASSRTATPTQARPQTHVRDATDNPVAGAMQETLRGRGGGGDVSKRTSMSLSEMIE